MADNIVPPRPKALRPIGYENFRGLDTSRDITSQDTGNGQVMRVLQNAYADFRGQIVSEAGYKIVTNTGRISHIRYYAPGEFLWFVRKGDGTDLHTQRGFNTPKVFSKTAKIASTVFHRRAFCVASGEGAISFDGTTLDHLTESDLQHYKPSYITTVQRRLIIAGVKQSETTVYLGRVDSANVFPESEDTGSANVLRAGYIDIGNMIPTGETIKGIAPFEQDRLAIFTQDRCILYIIDPNIDKWQLDPGANINVGTLSHRTIVSANTDLLFCSRTGVHSVQRSRDNGILVSAMTMSDNVKELYRTLVASVEHYEDISAVWDKDEAKYHIFFPQRHAEKTIRLTLSLNPTGERANPTWSTGSFLQETCADFLGGDVALGTMNGVVTLMPEGDRTGDLYAPFTISTPFLWNGAITETKQAMRLLLQASGKAQLTIKATNEDGEVMWSEVIDVEDDEDDKTIPRKPLSSHYELPFECRYKAVRLHITGTAKGDFKMTGFAIYIQPKS